MEAINAVDNGEKVAKKGIRQRNSSYPSYTIESCNKLATRIDTEFSNINYIPTKDISENLGLSGGAFLQQLSSCVQYGLLELKSGEGYKPTLLFEKIKKPLPNENVNDALIECFQNPALYKRLINDLREKQLPSEKGLANTLDRTYGLKGNAANVAAKVFLKNVQALGLLANGNILKLDAGYIPFEETESDNSEGEVEKATKNTQPLLIQAPVEQKQIQQPLEPSKTQTRVINVLLKGENREAKLTLPTDFTEADLKRIVKVLDAYLTE